jgi:transcriptional regulator with XRE-family HTH domain
VRQMETESTEKNIFEILKEHRLQMGLSLENVAEKSRIQLKFLESLEKGDLLKIPEVYDKLFFRSYLKAIEIDEEEYFEQFVEYRKAIRIDKTMSVIQINPALKDLDKKIFSHRNLFVVLPISLIVIVVVLLLINTEMVGTSSEGKVQEIDIVNIVDRIEAREKAKQDSIILQKELSTGLNMNIGALKKTWFRIVADKADTSEYLLIQNQKVNLRADSTFEFLIGRADGLSISLNGKNLDMSGTDSSVVRYMLIDSSGIVIKLLKSNTTNTWKADESEST